MSSKYCFLALNQIKSTSPVSSIQVILYGNPLLLDGECFETVMSIVTILSFSAETTEGL